MKIKRSTLRYILLFVIMCLELQCVYLLPTTWTVFGLNCEGICVVIEMLCFLYIVIQKKGKINCGKFDWIIWTGLLLVFTSSIAGKISYGQSVLTGLILQRTRIANFLFFFAVYTWYQDKKISISGIKKTLIIFSIVCGVIYIAQYILANRLIFTYSTTTQKTRYGTARFWFNTVYLVIVSAMSLDKLMMKKKAQWKDLFLLLLPVFVAVVIVKSRTIVLSIVSAIFICLFIHKGSGRKKIVGISAVIIGFFVLSFTLVGQDLFSIITQGVSQEDTITVRSIGRNYYLLKTFESPVSFLLGCGCASSNNYNALNVAYPTIFSGVYGYNIMLYPQDNGIFGQFFFYGIVGVVWWVCILITFAKYGMILHKKTGKTLYLFFVIIEAGFSITSIPVLFGSKLIITFMIIMLTDEYRQMVISENS